MAEALLVGTANITASVGSVVSNTARVSVIGSVLESIEILPRAEQSIAKGTSFNYRVVAIYNDLSQVDITTEATLSSSDTSIATIETNNAEAGTAFGIEVGSVSINASYKGIDAVAVSLVVTNAVITSIQVTPAEVTLALGSTQQFQAIAYYSDLSSKDATHVVSWRSSDSDIIEIKSGISSGGYAITGKIGSANISASINSVNSNVADVEVIAPTLESVEIIANDVDFPKGSTVFYTAFAKYSDGSIIEITSSTTWISSDTNIATVSGGEVYGVNVGGSNISIEYESKTDTQAITVRDPIVDYLLLTPSYAEINVGDVRQYLAVAYFTDGSKQDVSLEATWSSSDSDVAHVYIDNNLVNVEAFASGTATITATYNEKSDTSNLVVLNSVTLNSITITPLDETVLIGSTKQFSALANYSDGSVVDITTSSSWASSDTSIATISENQIFGLARGVDVGVTTISALFESVSASTSLNVTNDCGNSKPVSTFILPYNTTVTVATNMQYHLFGLWADGCEMELTYNNANSWSSEDEDIITIGKKDGLSLAVEVGTTNIVAGYQGQSDAISPVTVISAEVLSVSIQPAPSATIARGAAQSYVCSARMAIDGVEQPEEFITGLASYSSSQKLVAVIGVNNGSTQSVDAQNIIGNSTITCYYGGKSSESQLIVE